MLIEHRGVAPSVAESAYIAPTAVVCGDVEIGEDCRIMFGAVLVAEDAPVRVGARTVIMENAVVRAWPQLPVSIGLYRHRRNDRTGRKRERGRGRP